jgi:hypothetical protein
MRAAQLCSLIVPAALGAALGLALVGCHKSGEAPGQAQSVRTLHVEAYNPPIAKAPLNGKLETMGPRVEAVAGGSPAPDGAAARPATLEPAAVPAAVASEPRRLALPPADAGRPPAPVRQLLPPPPPPLPPLYRAPPPRREEPEAEAVAEPGFRITLPVCRRAAGMNDPLADSDECREILDTARQQARLCAEAFEEGDDEIVMSRACRQAARFR